MSKKIALIESGTYYHYFSMNDDRFKTNFNEIIYAPNLSKIELNNFDVVIVADRNHKKYLLKNKEKLTNFALQGGVLCVLGENSVEEWIDGINFKSTDTNFWWWLDKNADIGYKQANLTHPLFENLTFEECKWHYHGVYYPNNNVIKIIEREDNLGGGTILYEEALGKGKLIVTSLDPFFHIGSNFMPNTSKFLKGLLAYLKQ